MLWIRCSKQLLVMVLSYGGQVLMICMPKSMTVQQSLNMVRTLSLTSSLMKKLGILITRREPNRPSSLPPEDLFMVKKFIYFLTDIIDSAYLVKSCLFVFFFFGLCITQILGRFQILLPPSPALHLRTILYLFTYFPPPPLFG